MNFFSTKHKNVLHLRKEFQMFEKNKQKTLLKAIFYDLMMFFQSLQQQSIGKFVI